MIRKSMLSNSIITNPRSAETAQRVAPFFASFWAPRLGCCHCVWSEKVGRFTEIRRTQQKATNQGRTTMKLAAIVLASAFALSSTYAFAATQYHKKHHGTYAQSSAYAGNPNNRGGLVGGDDPGTAPA